MIQPPESDSTHKARPLPSLLVALIPVVFLITALGLVLGVFEELGLENYVPLAASVVVASVVALRLGYSFREIFLGMVHGVRLAFKAIMILFVIGILVATWIQAGIVPSMIAYGLDLFSPSFLLVLSCVICALVSVATGSSWSTAATVGIALIGVGDSLDIPRPLMAGAIISGAYFGDKISPLSDTTNLAPAVAGAELFDHIRHMLYTTVPSITITLIIFFVIGFFHGGEANTSQVQTVRDFIESSYKIHYLLLLGPAAVIAIVALRVPALPALIVGALLGGVVAATYQGQPIGDVAKAAYFGVTSETGNVLVDDLLSGGGLSSMYSTILLIVCALSFGGVMEKARMLEAIAAAVLKLAKGTGGLVLSTVATCIGMNALASDQYLAIVVPGRMYKETFDKQGLAPKNLSRALEDSGTLTSPLIPWNTCGAYMIETMTLEPWSYVPFCFMNLINPILSVIYGYTGFTMHKVKEEKQPKSD